MMEPQAILAALDEPFAPYQREAVDAAVAQQEAITPFLLERLEAITSDPEGWLAVEDRGPLLLYSLVLLPHFRETRAHSYVLSLAALPGDVAEPLLGDAISELLAMALWRTSGGDITGIQEVAQDRRAYGYGRWAGMEALTQAALLEELDAESIRATLGEWLADDSFAARGDSAWEALMVNLLALHATEHAHLLRRRVREGYIAWPVQEREIDDTFNRDREAALAEARKWAERRLSDDVHSHLSHWASFQPGFWDEPEADEVPAGELFASQDLPPLWEGAGSMSQKGSKPAAPDPKKKKKKRKQQKADRKANRKKRK